MKEQSCLSTDGDPEMQPILQRREHGALVVGPRDARLAFKDSYPYSYHFWMGAGLSKVLRDGETLPTHEIAFAREVSDRVAFLQSGRVHEIGPAEQVIDRPCRSETAVS